jgi:hypothetical protein
MFVIIGVSSREKLISETLKQLLEVTTATKIVELTGDIW